MAAQPCKFCGGKGAIQWSPNAPPVVCPVCGGTGIQPDPGVFYVYELTAALTANQANGNFNVQIVNNAFKWMFAMAQFTGNFQVQLSDSSTNRFFSNQQVHVLNLFGNAQNPFPLLTPYVFQVRGQILATLTDLSGAPNNVRLAFAGVEIAQ